MSLSSFNTLAFRRKVDDALRTVERTLELERKPRLAADVDHTYGAKYGLVDSTSNAAIIAYVNCLAKLGLDAETLTSIDATRAVTLRFEPSTSCKFLEEVKVDVPVGRSYEETEETKETTEGGDSSKTTAKSRVVKAVNHVTEYHWEVEVNWSLSIYSGTSVDEKRAIKSRKNTGRIITQKKDWPGVPKVPPAELSLTWLLQQMDTSALSSQFRVDTEDDETKTPRRNKAVEEAVGFATNLGHWCDSVRQKFVHGTLSPLIASNNPAVPKPITSTTRQLLGVKDISIFNPILPLMEEEGSTTADGNNSDVKSKCIIGLQSVNVGDEDQKELLSSKDITKLLNEHIKSLEEAVSGVESSWPSDDSDDILSSAEATVVLLTYHLKALSTQFTESMTYVESMMENQLIAAIGKKLQPSDVDKFVKFHDARLLQPMPRPFSHAIRRPEHYPVGLLSIESHDGSENECIHSHSREVEAATSLIIPLSAAVVLELTGQQHVHGYLNQRFDTSHKRHQLIARARQFSSFILVIGNMADGSTLEPKDAIIVQNKDELLIPLLLEEIPTAKEFKDAVKSLSPEQQRFACAYRKMQLASSVFGICVIQIKPQLEALLGLPADALDKEMKLTQDLMELFVEYQVPSDLLSYDGFSEGVATADKVSNVRTNVKGVLDVIDAEKEGQLKKEQAKTEMAMEMRFQEAARGMPTPTSFTATASAKARGGAKRSKQRAPKMAYCAAAMAEPMMLSCEDFGAPLSQELLADMSLDLCTAEDAPIPQQRQAKEQSSRDLRGDEGQSKPVSDQGVDFTLLPQILDAAVEKSGEGNALRSTTIKTGDAWVRNRQENLLSAPKKQQLDADEIKKEKNKAFDLLDALSRSGSLPIAYSELHVIVAVTHCFDKDVMSTVICDNVNPIEKLECSTLLLASAVHGVPARELIRDAGELQRLEGALPLLLEKSGEDDDVCEDEDGGVEV